jgi:hypothetical protein
MYSVGLAPNPPANPIHGRTMQPDEVFVELLSRHHLELAFVRTDTGQRRKAFDFTIL